MQSLTVPLVVVVVGAASEAPRIAVVRPGVGVRRAAHVNRAHRGSGLAVHTGDRVGRRVRKPGVGRAGTGVRRDHHRRVGLGDAVVDRAAACCCSWPCL